MSVSQTDPAPLPSAAGEDLDPEIRKFVETMSALWKAHPPLAKVPLDEARRIAEEVRSHWTADGPEMLEIREYEIPFHESGVRVRLHLPDQRANLPVLVYLHGGGWTLFSIDSHDRLMREYAARAGIAVAGVDYSLSPEAKFPQAIEETLAVVRWLRDESGTAGVDGRRIALGGDSAGAAMTVGACTALRDAGEADAVCAMLLNYGAFDATCDRDSYRRYGNGGYLWDSGEMEAFWNNYLRSPADADNPLACPLRAELHGLPHAFLAIPECDVIYDENLEMGEKLRRAGVAAQSVVYPGATHSFLEAVSIARISDRAFSEAAKWLSDMLRTPLPPSGQ